MKKDAAFDKQLQTHSLYAKKSYAYYLAGEITSYSIFGVWKRILFFTRQFRLLRLILRALAYVVFVIETSAVLIVVSGALLIILIPVVSAALGIYAFSLVKRRKDNKRLLGECEGKTVFVYHPPKNEALDNDSYFCGMVREAAECEDNIVFVVSPYFWAKTGLEKRGFYIGCRKADERLIILRRYYYFSFKKRVLRTTSGRVCYIY